jgi:sugar phosphate isomerase/epimerase
MRTILDRREALGAAGTTLAAIVANAAVSTPDTSQPNRSDDEPFGYCLNTSTIRLDGLGIVEKIEIAAKAGYKGLEPWIREFDEYTKGGGALNDLAKRIRDAGLTVESAIGFAEWIVDDDARRAKGFEEAKRSMEIVAQVGGTRLAAPPAGATDKADLNLLRAADRYRALLELGDQMGVVPQVELWGFSKSLSRLGEVFFVAIESGHPKACVLTDVYHIYKGGSDPSGLALVRGARMHVMHMNDYPADPPRETITDAHRVYPGDGVAPLDMILRTLRDIGFRGMLSLELFNREYWKQDPLTVARTGIEKIRAAVRKCFG